MTLLNLLTKTAVLSGTAIGSVLVGLPFAASAIATPVAQLPSQQLPGQPLPSQQLPGQPPIPSSTIVIPGTGASVQLSQIRVASVPSALQNPCPRIYYEAPFSQYVVVPQQCSPNLITQQLDQLGMLQIIRATGNTNFPGGVGGPATPYTPPVRTY